MESLGGVPLGDMSEQQKKKTHYGAKKRKKTKKGLAAKKSRTPEAQITALCCASASPSSIEVSVLQLHGDQRPASGQPCTRHVAVLCVAI